MNACCRMCGVPVAKGLCPPCSKAFRAYMKQFQFNRVKLWLRRRKEAA
jgi:hypothetical protein